MGKIEPPFFVRRPFRAKTYKSCKECRFWESESPHSYWLGDGEWGACLRTRTDYGKPSVRATMAQAHDIEGRGAQLYVRDVFSCVMFEEKEGSKQCSA